MPHLPALLAVYYLCDQAAAQTVLPPDEYAHCAAIYESMKLEFIDEPPARRGTRNWVEQNRLGYRGLKAWEAANPDLVARYRTQARTQLGF